MYEMYTFIRKSKAKCNHYQKICILSDSNPSCLDVNDAFKRGSLGSPNTNRAPFETKGCLAIFHMYFGLHIQTEIPGSGTNRV